MLSIQPHPQSDPGAAVSARLRWHAWVNLLVVGWITVTAAVAVAAGYGSAPPWLPVHTFLLGAATTAVVIWSEHFAVAVTHSRQPERRASVTRLLVLTGGQIATVAGALADQPILLAIGATVVAAAVAAHGWTLLRLRRNALGGRLTGIVDYYLAACASLLLGAPLGGLMGAGAFPDLHDRMHLAHEHLNVGGWLLLTVVGTLFMLWPSAARTQMDAWTAVAIRWCLRLAAPGLAIAVAGMLLDARFVTAAGLALYACGIAVATAPIARTMRRKRPNSGPTWLLTGALVWLLAVVVADAVLAVLGRSEDAEKLGPAVLAGVLGQALLGSLTYLLPVVLGGGADGARKAAAFLDAYWPVRVAALNVGVLLVVGTDPALGRAGWALLSLTGIEALVRLAVLLLSRLSSTGLLRRFGPGAAGAGIGVIITIAAVAVAVSGQSTSSGQATVVANGRTSTVDVMLGDMRITPNRIEVAAGTHLILKITNHDSQSHDLRTSTVRTPMLKPHQGADLDLGIVGGPIDAWCDLPGHRAAGMKLRIEIGAAAAQNAAAPPARDAALPPAATGTVHRIDLPIVETEQQVAPGVERPVWTFGGTMPGPTLRGKVGDLFEITLINQGSMDHGVDFHAGAVAPDGVMRTIQPGERLTYRFRAERAGIWLYHCSTMPMSEHIAAGMFGAVIIDPPGLPAVDREYLLVESELYNGIPGTDATMAAIQADTPDGWAFNGAGNQYDTQPLTATAGQRVRFWVLNAGPGSTASFHIVGAQFDTVYSEGAYQLRNGIDPFGERSGGAQALGLTPAQGGFVEAVFAEPGTYALVDHDMRHAEAGAHGKLVVTR